MNRRTFIQASMASVLVAFSTGFENPAQLGPLSDAFHRAAQTGSKLLVFVIPEDDEAKLLRGRALGEFLNHGADPDVSRLAGVTLVAATAADVRVLVPHAPPGEPVMWLVDPASVPSQITVLRTELPDPVWRTHPDPTVAVRIGAIAALLRPHLPESSDPSTVAQTLRQDVLSQRIPGSYWARSGGCGSYIEGVENQLMARCGMGHVDARSTRLLHFFEVGA